MRVVKYLQVSVLLCLAMQVAAQEESFSVRVTGTGRDVILIPGLMSDTSVWEFVEAPLAAHHRLHLLHVAGFSGQAPIAGDILPLVREQLIAYVREQRLDRPPVIGHSLGGFVAIWAALEAPESFGPLISIDGLPYYAPVLTRDAATTPETMGPQARQIADYYATLDAEQLQAMARQSLTIQSMHETNREKILTMATGSDAATVGKAVATLLTTDLRSRLDDLTQPLLLLGALGPAQGTPLEASIVALYEQQLERNPRAELRFTRAAGHFIPLDEPQWLLEQIADFLESPR